MFQDYILQSEYGAHRTNISLYHSIPETEVNMTRISTEMPPSVKSNTVLLKIENKKISY